MPEANITKTLGTALSIDFVQKFGANFKSLHELLGVQRVLPMQQGMNIKTYTSSVTLAGETIAPGELIPLSEVKREAGPSYELTWDKKRKAVALEDIQKYGFDTAISMTDAKLLNAIQKGIRTKVLAQLATGTGTAAAENLQGVLAKNWATVTSAFDEDDVEVISFINPFDAGYYLANANVTTQTLFGMTYLEGFLNNRVVFMSAEIPQGTVYSTAADNLVVAYADMAGGDVKQTFDFTVDSTGLIGVTHDINKARLTAETITAYGVVLFAERLDGVVVGAIEGAPVGE